KTSRDMANRARGIVAGTKWRLRSEEADEPVLEARVRAKVGRFVSHPHAIEVHADGGHVTLGGPILADEVPGLLEAVRSVRGVEEVVDQLELHEDADVPALQGGVPRPGERFELLQDNWSP